MTLNALDFLPDNLRDNEVMLKIADFLNVLISTERPTFNVINNAYNDSLFKIRDYSKLSYEAKIEILKELGFEYITDVIKLTSDQLTKMLIFFNLIYILKGKEEGLRLVLNNMNIVYTYTVWDNQEPKGEPLTAELKIIGGDASLISKIKKFVRSYMLVWTDISLRITIEAPSIYAYGNYTGIRRIRNRIPNKIVVDLPKIAVYDIDNYDASLYGDSTSFPDLVTFTVVPFPRNAVVEINNKKVKTLNVSANSIIKWKVYMPDGSYEPQEGSLSIKEDTIKEVDLVIVIPPKPNYTFTINAVPSNATVIINETKTNTITLEEGSSIKWNVQLNGYITQSGNLTLNADQTLNIKLEEDGSQYIGIPLIPTMTSRTEPYGEAIGGDYGYTLGKTTMWGHAYLGMNQGSNWSGDSTINDFRSFRGYFPADAGYDYELGYKFKQAYPSGQYKLTFTARSYGLKGGNIANCQIILGYSDNTEQIVSNLGGAWYTNNGLSNYSYTISATKNLISVRIKFTVVNNSSYIPAVLWLEGYKVLLFRQFGNMQMMYLGK